jgi:hypothetical protein
MMISICKILLIEVVDDGEVNGDINEGINGDINEDIDEDIYEDIYGVDGLEVPLEEDTKEYDGMEEVHEFGYCHAGTGSEHGWVNDANIRVDFSKVTTYEKWIARVDFLKSNVLVAVIGFNTLILSPFAYISGNCWWNNNSPEYLCKGTSVYMVALYAIILIVPAGSFFVNRLRFYLV